MQHLCDDIRQARQLQGLSYEDIYKKFRVPTFVVQALEEDDYERLPAAVYARGFISTYCRELGLDPTPYIHHLEQQERKPWRFSFAGIGAGEEDEVPEWLENLRLWAVVFAVVTFGWFAYSLVVDPGAPPDQGRVRAESVDFGQSDPLTLP